MLNDAAVSQFKKVYLAPGYTDLRRGIDGLASIVRFQFELDPYDKNTLFCSAEEKTAGSRHFCGKAMVSFSCTKGWITVLSGGQGRQMKQWPSQMTSTGC